MSDNNELNIAGKRTSAATTTAQTRTTMVNGLGSSQQTTSNGDANSFAGPRSRINMKTTRRATTTPATTRASTTTTNTPCDGMSGQHNSYLKDNLDIVRQKCSEFHACTVELYKSENLHRILAGDNIQLRNICGDVSLIPGDGFLAVLLFHASALKRSVVQVVRPTGSLVTVITVYTHVISYACADCFNVSPLLSSADPLPLRRLIGVVCGVSLISLLIVIIVVLCLRQRKLKRRLYVLPAILLDMTTESKRSANTTSPTDETCCSNQGIRDRPQVPERYIAYHGSATTSRSDYDYLELLPDVACVYHKNQLPEHPATVAIQPPPQDRPYALAKHVAPSPASDRKTRATEGPDRSLEEATYFDKIDIKSVTETSPDGGYTPLGLTPTLVARHQSADSEDGESGNPHIKENNFYLKTPRLVGQKCSEFQRLYRGGKVENLHRSGRATFSSVCIIHLVHSPHCFLYTGLGKARYLKRAQSFLPVASLLVIKAQRRLQGSGQRVQLSERESSGILVMRVSILSRRQQPGEGQLGKLKTVSNTQGDITIPR
ncbi:hypothetical protein C0Q70_00482 [Pomacea canaliculata]|uniref:Uncharacterized protein n=1 Tax=Pomacea canaliculata TaxID=400727 RepID=A0A2T7PWW0_POMCA|nr:hypothetical protein C0Q70_00482 [Pomacea canaliculata]